MAGGTPITVPSPNLSLWEQAAMRLSDKNKAVIFSNSKVSLDEILASIESKKIACREKQWTVSRGLNKNALVLRDVFAKIASWIEKFVAVGDIAMQYDPGHAALPWAAVRFLLQLSVQDVQRYATIIEGVERVSKIITRCKILESLYMRKRLTASLELEHALVDLYITVLSFLGKALRYYSKGTPKRTLESLTDFKNKFLSYAKTMGEEEQEVYHYTALMDSECQKNAEEGMVSLNAEQKVNDQRLRSLLSDLQRPIDRMENHLQDQADGFKQAERTKILQWLSPVPYMQHHVQAGRDVLKGTGRWFLDDPVLLEWHCSSSSSILWLHGIPGSGKSKLISILIQQLLNECLEGRHSYPNFFYCTRNNAEPERAKPDVILRSLVRQLSCSGPSQAVDDVIQNLYDEKSRRGFVDGPLSREETISTIINLLERRSSTTIIIDALDECDRSEREYLLDALSRIIQDSKGLVKICVSSRDDLDIVYHLEDCPNLEIAASKNQGDIVTFVRSELERQIGKKRLLYGKVPDVLRNQIQEVLCDQARGMFRWVSLQLQYLCSIKVATLVEKRLGTLPQSLRQIYDETYNERIHEYDKEETAIVQSALRWLLCSPVSLRTRAFLAIVSSSATNGRYLDLSRDALMDLCFNLIVQDAEVDVFRFSHLSVQEYLEGKAEYDPELNHAFAAEYCMGIFISWPSSTTETGMSTMTKLEKLLTNHCTTGKDVTRINKYACLYWARHVYKSGSLGKQEPLRSLLASFLMQDGATAPGFARWHKDAWDLISGGSKEIRVNGQAFSFHPHSGWESEPEFQEFRAMISKTADVLYAASFGGFQDVLKLRIQADPLSLNTQNLFGATALQLACTRGNIKEAEMLLEQDVDIDSRYHGNETTALGIAVREGHTALVELLLEKHANPYEHVGLCPISDMYSYLSPRLLYVAVTRGHNAILRSLLKFVAGIPGADEEKCTLLQYCVHQGNENMVQAILDSSPVSQWSRECWSAATRVMPAIPHGKESVKRVFEGLRSDGFTLDVTLLGAALWRSLKYDAVDVAAVLVDNGADVNVTCPQSPYPALSWCNWLNTL